MMRRWLALLNGDHDDRLTLQRYIDREQPKPLTKAEIRRGLEL